MKNLQNQVFFIIIVKIEKLQAQKVIKTPFSLEAAFLSKMSSVNTVKLMIKLLLKYHDYTDIFDKQAVKILPSQHFYNHKIELKSSDSLFKSWLYLMSKKKLQKIKKYLSENLNKWFIVLSKVFFTSLILFVIKLNDSLHFCVNYYWHLNTLTHWDSYLLPLIDKTLTQIVDCKFIIKFDIITVFNKLRMHLNSKKLTTFCILIRVYKYWVLPFDLINELTFFQHYINDTLFECLNDYAQAYLNDILIYSKIWQEHVKHVENVLEKLQTADLQIDIKKSEFFITEIIFLNLLIFINELRINP